MDTQSQSQSQTHQIISASLELSVPIGNYCLDKAECRFLISGGFRHNCMIFGGAPLTVTPDWQVTKCDACKEAKVKI